jgi:molybdopterin-guanine dinucleotide biosynthesis protein A
MGRSKAWLPFGETTMLRAVLEAVEKGLRSGRASQPGFSPPLVVVGARQQDLPPLPQEILRVDDEVEGEGPLRGMAAGLAALEGRAEAAYVSSCDTPLLQPSFVSRMIVLLGEADIAVPLVEDRHHPLAAVYRLSVLKEVRDLLAAERRRPFFLFERVSTRMIGREALVEVDPDLDSLKNFNTPAEYEELVARVEDGRGIGGSP